MKKQLMLLVGLMLVLSVFLAACTGKDNADEGDERSGKERERNETEEEKEEPEEARCWACISRLMLQTQRQQKKTVNLHSDLLADTPFEGTLSPVFYSGAYDC